MSTPSAMEVAEALATWRANWGDEGYPVEHQAAWLAEWLAQRDEDRTMDPAPLPEGWVEVERMSVRKCLDEQGQVSVRHHATPGLGTWEAIGMAVHVADMLRRFLQDVEQSDDEGDDDGQG